MGHNSSIQQTVIEHLPCASVTEKVALTMEMGRSFYSIWEIRFPSSPFVLHLHQDSGHGRNASVHLPIPLGVTFQLTSTAEGTGL